MDLKGKRLLILGGSRISCEIVEHARKMGIVTGVTDWYPLEKSPAKQIADEAYYESTSDISAMVSLIKDKKFDGVITGFTDSVLPYYAEICEKAGLPSYGTREQFEIFIDKKKYKSLLRKFDIPTIPEYEIDLQNIEGSVKNVSFPVLVKPADSSGSRGITICNNSEEIRDALSGAIKASETKNVLVEQYIDAPECTVFWLFKNGKYHLILIGNRHIKYTENGLIPLPVGYTYPAACLPKYAAEIAPKVRKMLKHLGIMNGTMFMQCKIVDGTPWVYDIGYRATGSLEYVNLKAICGYDTLDMLIHFALTGEMGEQDVENRIDPYLRKQYAYNVSLLCKPGKIAEIDGLEIIKSIEGVKSVFISHQVGDEITYSMKGLLAQITIRVLGCASNIESMKAEMLAINKYMHIISDVGEEMVLPGMEEKDFINIL